MILFILFIALSFYNLGCMLTLQLQHYAIYPAVGREKFVEYIRANNSAARIPTILPAMLLLVTSILLLFFPPPFVRPWEAATGLGLNLVQLASTFRWQRPIQAEMAMTGYSEEKVQLLIHTNWVRTISYLLLSILSISILVRLMR